MNAMLTIGFILFLVLGVVTLVGHGIWVMLAKVFGPPASTPLPRRPTRGHGCPGCAELIPTGQLICTYCGWAPGVRPEQKALAALTDLRRTVEKLNQRSLLNDESYARLVATLNEECARYQPAASTPPVTAHGGRDIVPEEPASTLDTAGHAAEWAIPVKAEIPDGAINSLSSTLAGSAPGASVEPLPTKASTTSLPAERVRRFVQRREMPIAADSVAAAPRKAARPWSEILVAFMEQRHIRWGELVGGLLIVCCSIALVISFWSEIAERPFLKFFVFNGVTAALFGLGLYAERRWKLETTSHGLLLIASLLVPLNFLAIAAFSTGTAPLNLVTLGGETLSVILFSALLFLAGKIVLAQSPWLFTASVIVPSIVSLVVRRHIHSEISMWPIAAVAAVITLVYAIANTVLQVRYRQYDALDETAAHGLMKLLGVSTFAAALPAALLLSKSGNVAETLHRLSVVAPLIGLPALAMGLLFWRKLTSEATASLRTAGTAIAALGIMVALSGIGLAWPDPAQMLPTALMNFVILAGVALAFSIPAAHVLSAGCLAMTLLLGGLWFAGDVQWQMAPHETIRALTSSRAAVAFTFVAAALLSAAAALARIAGRTHARWYLPVVGLCAIGSIALVSWRGLGRAGDTSGAVWIYAMYSVAAVAAAIIMRRAELTWTSALLAALAVVQGLVFTFAERLELAHPWLVALLLHATVYSCMAAIVDRRFQGWAPAVQSPAQWFAIASSFAAAGITTWLIGQAAPAVIATAFAVLAVLWMVLALVGGQPALCALSQSALVGSIVFAVAHGLLAREWVLGPRSLWLDPRSLQAHGVALVALAFGWLGLRSGLIRSMERRSSAASAVASEVRTDGWTQKLHGQIHLLGQTLDEVLLGLTLVLLLCISAYAAAPGAAIELSPRTVDGSGVASRLIPPAARYELFGLPHWPALGAGSWVLLCAVVGLAAMSMRYQYRLWKVLVLLLALSAAVPLLAGRWEAEVAVASALRWLAAGYLLLGSIVIWSRDVWLDPLRRAGFIPNVAKAAGTSRPVRTTVFALSLAPIVVMGIYVAAAAVARVPPGPDTRSLLLAFSILFAVLGLVAIILRQVRPDSDATAFMAAVREGSTVLIVLAAAPLLSVSLYVLAVALQQRPILGPDPASIFAEMGNAVSYSVPIFVIAFTLVGYALRERDAAFAFSGGMLLAAAATAGYLLALAKTAAGLDAVQWVRLAQLNAGVLACYGLAWMGLVLLHRRNPVEAAPRTLVRLHPLLFTVLVLPPALHLLVLFPAAAGLVLQPYPAAYHLEVGSSAGWLGIAVALLAGIAAGFFVRTDEQQPGFAPRALTPSMMAGAAILAVGIILTCTVSHWDTGNWLAFHTLLGVFVLSSASAVTIGLARRNTSQVGRLTLSAESIAWGTVVGAIAVLVALRALSGDPQAPWWTIGVLGVMSATASAIAWGSAGRVYLYAAAAMVNLAATLCWLESPAPFGLPEFLHVSALALAVPAPIWLFIEVIAIRPANRWRGVPMHRLATWLSLGLLALVLAAGLAADLESRVLVTTSTFGWLACSATLAAMIACLWDEWMRRSVLGLYLAGLTASGMLVDRFNLEPRWLVWTGTIVLAAYGLATSYLWSRRQGVIRLATQLFVPSPAALLNSQIWIVPANGLLALAVVVLGFYIQLTYVEVSLRLLAAQAILVQALAIGLLARGERSGELQYAALSAGALGAVAFAWSWLQPGASGTPPNYAVAALVALVAVVALYGFGLSKFIRRENAWTTAAQRLAPVLIAVGAVDVLVVLSMEAAYYARGQAIPIGWGGILTTALTLPAVAVCCLAAALIPGRDPLQLSEHGRTAYVYAAEALLGLFFLHIRVTMPWLFRGLFAQYWPLVVILLAFLGVALSEVFRRQRRHVLAEPLERTGAMLPLLPVLGFWFAPAEVHFSVLMLAVGGVYAALSAMRRSFGFGVLAALAANGGLWYFLHHTGATGLLEHPQLWLIPPSLCVLVAAYLNQDRLNESQMTSLRYLAAGTLYVSSTADIFLNGVANAPYLPLVLGALALAGIFAGILLRVRGFLFLGTGFLMLALLTIIWYAAVDLDQTWIWAVSGIVTGVLIIALFAVFEKKRQDILRLVDQLKQWEA